MNTGSVHFAVWAGWSSRDETARRIVNPVGFQETSEEQDFHDYNF